MSELTNPHDKFFKEMFGQLELARDFLQNYLPAAVLNHLDLSQIQLEKESFIDPQLREHFSDLLFSVPRRDNLGLAFIFFLFEHKSFWYRWTWLQLLGYIVEFWKHQKDAGANTLSPIIPLVIYHGKEKWKGSRQLADLYDGPEDLKLYLPDFIYPVYDFSYLSEEEIRGQASLQITLHILRHIFDGQLVEKLPGIFALFRELENQEKALQSLVTVLRYLAVTAERVTPEQMQQVLAPVLQYQGDELMSTLAQQWIEEGRQQGMQQGMQQGLLQAMRQNVVELLEERFPAQGRKFRGRIEAIHNLDTLRLLVRRAATVDSLAEFEQALDTLTNLPQ
ncbi:MAG: Rpn family recombination-promoting nuclease/putative transposase [Anaerolineae bacterium]|nr:Rpn family recombination-promoting nuclease/putative transposase [Anaerolineae bacterium]